jgi:hypothetical protein
MSLSAEGIHARVMIPELLRAAPQLRSVLDRYGLRGCGGPLGPVESLEFFARAHDVPLEPLLRELRDALGQVPAPSAAGAARASDAIYQPFFRAGIVVVLTIGALWGAFLLLRIAWSGSFRAAGVHEVNAHGHAQIFGWVGLFVMGFAYQAFPRFKHTTLAWPRLAWASLVLLLVGLVGRSLGEPLASRLSWAGAAAVVSAWLEVVAVALFAAVILATWRAAGKGLAFYDGYILASLGWFVLQAVFEAVYLQATLAAASHQELLGLVATWQGALRDMQIHGFALLMILGVSQRIAHHFYGLPSPSRRLSLAALACINLAVVGEVVGLVMMRGPDRSWAALWYGSVLLLAAVVVALVWNWGIFGRAAEPDRSLKYIRAAYAWLLISLAMLVLLPAYQFALLPWLAPSSAAAKMGFSHAYYGAIRHAITVGFISQMILGVAARVVPTLKGVDLHGLKPLWGPFLLLGAGCALRVVAQTMTDFTPHAFLVAGASGLLEVTGLALWSAHLWAVMAGWAPAHQAPTPAYLPGARIEADQLVGAVLEAHPELLQTFLGLGFTPLANPLLRTTVARHITIATACRQLGRSEEVVVETLNRACNAVPAKTHSLPLVSVS